MIIAELSVAPIGEGTSLGRYVKEALEAVKASNVKHSVGAMGTTFEAESLDLVFAVVKAAHEAVLKAGAKRIVTILKVDDRRDKTVSIKSKLQALE